MSVVFGIVTELEVWFCSVGCVGAVVGVEGFSDVVVDLSMMQCFEVCVDGACVWDVMVVDPGYAFEAVCIFVGWVVNDCNVVFLVSFLLSCVMREKSPAQSMLDYRC